MVFRLSTRTQAWFGWKGYKLSGQIYFFSAKSGNSPAEKPFYITTPIFYPNSDPHIGHLYSIVLADIFARYERIKSPSRCVKFITGTDEHGAKIQKAAYERGMVGKEREFCDKISRRFQALANKANIKYTRFIRTTEKDHSIAVSHIWRELDHRGYIYKGKHSGWYSISDECFYTASQVESVIDPTTNESHMVSKETGSGVEWTEEENYKFRLSAFRKQLLKRYQEDEGKCQVIDPSTLQNSIVPSGQLSLIRSTLENPEFIPDISISRPSTRLRWGIPVPDDPRHVIYVWLDALTSYLTAVGYPWQDGTSEGFSCGWPPDIQIIGKDILRFHAIYFPAFLLALDIPLPKTVVSHAHWTMDHMKMSKSRGNVANPFLVLQRFDRDVVRYYLARIGGRFQDDCDWSEEELIKQNQELLSFLGNLLSRAFSPKILERLLQLDHYTQINPSLAHESPYLHVEDTSVSESASALMQSLESLPTEFQYLMDRMELSEAIDLCERILRQTNQLYTHVAPWKPSTPPQTVKALLGTTRDVLRKCGILLQPVIPTKAGILLDVLRIPEDHRTLTHAKTEFKDDDLGVQPVTLPVKLFTMPKSPENEKKK